MANYEIVTKDAHADRRWKPFSDYKFAAQDALCPLVMQEAPKAALQLPIAFSKAGEHFGVFAVQALEVGSNYLVDAAGNWLAGYIPAAYRGYPFALATAEDEQQLLCVDADSGLLGNTDGNAFFDEDGEPSAKIKEILDFLSQVSANRQATHTLCLLLEELELLEVWPITVTKNDEDAPVEGLFRINEAKLNTLSAEDLLRLRDKGALPLIYCQLLSMQNLARLAQWANAESAQALPDELPFDFGKDEGNISFEGL